MLKLSDILQEETLRRNVVRDAFCVANGILPTAKNRAFRAQNDIRTQCGNLMVLFERLSDVEGLSPTQNWTGIEKSLLTPMMERARGYCIYFFAGFYPDDEGVSMPLVKSMNQSKVAMFFGGQYSKQCILNVIPSDIRRQEKPDPAYDNFVLNYRNEFFRMRMPCGPLVSKAEDPDDAAIIG